MTNIIRIDSKLFEYGYAKPRAVGGALKRAFDIILSILGLVAALPLFLFVTLAVKLSDPGPIIYRQVRVGLGGRPFVCFKFRTMCVDSEAVLAAHLDANPKARMEWEAQRKLIDDPRVSKLGRLLRRSSLDELPQLMNVLRGDMSLIGPRPIVTSEMSRYGDRLPLYLAARPGLSGAWQVSGRSDCSYDKRVALDADYVSNWRFSTDLWILLRTVYAVLERRGSY